MRILIVGTLFEDKWIGSLIRHLKKEDNSIIVDFFQNVISLSPLPHTSSLCENVYLTKKHFPSFLYKNSKLRILLSRIDIPISFEDFLKEQYAKSIKYDVVNIHYPTNRILKHWHLIKQVAQSIIVTPWGSEVLRLSKRKQEEMASYISYYDYVMTSDNPRFKEQLQSILHIKNEQFVDCDFGSEMIDLINENSALSKDEAKDKLGIKGKYSIVCGYNANVAQQHKSIINALISVKDKLPEDLIVVLPMTYGGTCTYIDSVKAQLDSNHIENLIFTEYLTNEELLYLRKSTDMFIHAQTTDANSVSLAEHLLCDNIVINGSWLRYENRERYGVPYYLFSDFNELPGLIVDAYAHGSIVPPLLIDDISQEGWRDVIKKWISVFKRTSNGN